jgi:anti-sigma factor RsiW
VDCSSVEPLLGAALDDELDPGQQLQVRQHMEECANCRDSFQEMLHLRDGIRSQANYYRAPQALAERLGKAIREEHAPAKKREPQTWKWMAIAASALLALSAGTNVFLSQRGTARTELVTQEVLSEHVRSMITNHQVDVISSDRHTVKPWFGDKLDFSPDVKDLKAQGFPLMGGRVDYVDQRPVAALVFQRAKHVISVFTWPGKPAALRQFSQNGYHVVSWTKDGMTYWAISDLNMEELTQFARLYGA